MQSTTSQSSSSAVSSSSRLLQPQAYRWVPKTRTSHASDTHASVSPLTATHVKNSKKTDSKEEKEKTSSSTSLSTEETALASLTQDRESLFRPFKLLLADLEEQLKAKKPIPFNDLHHCMDSALALLEADIYPESKRLPMHPAKTKKITLIHDIFGHVFEYFRNKIDATEIASLAFLFAKKSLKYHYDYAWLDEERNCLFKETIDFLVETMDFLAAGDRGLSTASVAKMIFALASFSINYTHPLRNQAILGLTRKAEHLHNKKRHFTVQQAFWIMDSVSRLHVNMETTTQKRKEFFVVLTTKALPLLLTVMEPLNMFNCLSLVHFRLAHIKRLLPPVFPDFEPIWR